MKKTGYDPFWDPWPPLQNAFFCVFPVLYAIGSRLSGSSGNSLTAEPEI